MRSYITQEKGLKPDDDGQWRVNLELRDAELIALGRVAAHWGFLENLLRELAKHMADALGEPLSADADSDSFRKRHRDLKSLVARAMANDPDRDRLLELIERVGSIQGERHRLIHGLIEWDESNKEALNVHTHKNPSGRPWPVTVETINGVADKIAALSTFIYNFPSDNPWPNIVAKFVERRDPGTPVAIDTEVLKKVSGDRMTWGTIEGLPQKKPDDSGTNE
jgi:hypothetical protein